jgi:hypothetical protein
LKIRLDQLKEKQLCAELQEGYQAGYDEDSQTNAEWKKATSENWEKLI